MRLVLAALCVVVLPSCDPSEPRSDAERLPGSASDTTEARLVRVVGAIDGGAEATFGLVSSIAAAHDGTLFVSDAMAGDIRIYRADGELITRLGRNGDGPGEFRQPTGLTLDGRGILYVRDETRVQRFAPSNEGSRFGYAGSFAGPPYGYLLESSRIDTAGRFYYPRLDWREVQRFLYLVLDSAGNTLDTLPVPESVRLPSPTAFLRTGASGGRMVPGLSTAPFAPVPSWAITPHGTLLVSTGDGYEITEVDRSGSTLRVIARDVPARPVSQQEYRDSVSAVRERVSALPAPLERLEGVAPEILSGNYSRTLPQVIGLHVGTDGRIWVERWPEEGSAGASFDVLSPDGRYLRTVLVPVRFARLPAPVFMETRIYGVVIDADTDVQQVGIFEVPEP